VTFAAGAYGRGANSPCDSSVRSYVLSRLELGRQSTRPCPSARMLGYGSGVRSNPPENGSSEALAGLVERVTFHNPENGFCVLRVKARGQRDLITVVSHAAMVSAGEFIQASGSWVTDRTGPSLPACARGAAAGGRSMQTQTPRCSHRCCPQQQSTAVRGYRHAIRLRFEAFRRSVTSRTNRSSLVGGGYDASRIGRD
jgi:hypothetical protein